MINTNTVNFEELFNNRFHNYSKKVLLDRAIPTIDGCKPVMKRILYSMMLKKMYHNKPHHKSSSAVSEALLRHPHGRGDSYATSKIKIV